MSKVRVVRAFARTRWLRHFRTRAALEQYQRRQLRKHLAFLKVHSPFFGALLAQTSSQDLTKLPLMDKQVMMSQFDRMNTVGILRDEALELAVASERSRDFTEKYKGISVGLSSGTSGHRGLFIVSDREREEWAGVILARYLPKGKPFGQRVAFFLRADNNLYETIASSLITFRYFDIYADMQDNLAQLELFGPTILVAPPSVLSVIADAVEAGDIGLNPDAVISVAEVLGPADEKRFQKVFHRKVIHQIYQCTEGFLAHTCEHGTLHLNEDAVFFEKEFLDRRRFVPIVTDFRRTSQPIVRYRHNDILVLRTRPCPCGSVYTALARIEGREGDTFVFKNAQQESVQVFADMITRCMLYVSGFREFRVVQTDYGHLDVYIDRLNAHTKQSVRAEFRRLARQLHFQPPVITFAPYVRDLSKKLRRVERAF